MPCSIFISVSISVSVSASVSVPHPGLPPPQSEGLHGVLLQYDMPLTRVLARMEAVGIGLDTRLLQVRHTPCARGMNV